MNDTIAITILFLLYSLFCAGLFFRWRNNIVYAAFIRIVNAVYEDSKQSINNGETLKEILEAGKKMDERYSILDDKSYYKMLLTFWTPVSKLEQRLMTLLDLEITYYVPTS